ncbi:V-type proton ATPase subunit H [Wuchereria bancrofti]|uniref:V-type proton ATPase subunit H n=1 Tax=Wuchereria bancrofti TaxID=6293 RepID=J9ETD0_WUCBA|nr:V-type proton ATPase subunit H [Wuchereria bancrofti]
MITQEDYDFITSYEMSKTKQGRDELLENNKTQCARTMISFITTVAKDHNVRYILTLLDDMIMEDKSRVEIFHSYARKNKCTLWSWFLGILQRQDSFIVNQMSSVLAKFACFGTTLMEGSDLNFYISFLKDQLKAPRNEYINTTARCLQMMLRIDEYRHTFLAMDGIASILSVLSGKTNFQLQYQLIFSLWCLTFNPAIAEKFPHTGAIQILGDILSESTKEKVIRIILGTFRNILEKIDDRDLEREAALQMVQFKTLKTLELMDSKKFDDDELNDDVEFLSERLHSLVQDFSSFDEYVSEVKSGRLQWSPVHKSEKFWRENAQKFNEKDFELLRQILEVQSDTLALCVAVHDIGEYVRHYPRGKNKIEQLQGKEAVMKLLSADDPNVRYHSLLAIQKLMVHNWEYLGKQLDADNAAVAAE